MQKNEKSALQFKVSRSVASSTQLEQSGLIVRTVDRYYVSAILTDAFGPSSQQAIHDFIKTKMDDFGGGCDQYDYNVNTSGTCLNDDCGKIYCSGSKVIDNQIGISSVIRQGWLTRACEEIANSDNSILFALQNIYVQPSLTMINVAAPTNETLTKAYALFYRSTAPDKAVISSLATIANLETTNNFEKWRYVLVSICTTSEWQIP